MALLNTINFLPQVFQTSTNQRFLGATMDQLFTGAVNQPINGYVGRRFAPTYKLGDNYVPEANPLRKYYQLEAGVVVTDDNKNIKFNAGYIDLLNSIKNYAGSATNSTSNHQRLFTSESYNFDGHFDYDKFVNYYDYYWLPNGPASVAISVSNIPYQATYTVERNTAVSGYTFAGKGPHANNQLTLVRGGTYTFEINQPGFNFWFQTSPGTSGQDPNISTVTTRQVYGVTNNGIDSGKITFKVPLATAQDFYSNMPIIASVDAAITIPYTKIQNRLLSDFLAEFPLGLDGINNQLLNKKFVFVNNDKNDSDWTTPTPDTGTFTDPAAIFTANNFQIPAGTVVSKTDRVSAFIVNLVDTGAGDYLIQVSPHNPVATQQKVFVTSGKTYASNQFWVNNQLEFQGVPILTASLDYLYYQDSSESGYTGQIKLIDNIASSIDVENDIIGSVGYTSPNGVVFTNGLKIQFDSSVTPASYAGKEYYVDCVGRSIALVEVDSLVVPEPFGIDIDTVPDYITINRASSDQNPWSRYNRWFHKDVILATAKYNDTTADYGMNLSARRSIIEFEPNLQLFNYGKQATQNVSYIITTATDAFNDFEGKVTATIDGITLQDGDRVIFSNDYDIAIINQVWEVQYETIVGSPYLTLNKTSADPILPGQNALITKGSHVGKTFYFDGTAWNQAQQKTNVNQTPLFDVVDNNGYSFSDTTVYPGSNFAGTKFFGYKVGSGNNDTVLGFPLTYQNFNNIGDIVFNNFYDTDTFTTADGTTTNINTGYLVLNDGLTDTSKLTNWATCIEPTQQFQVFSKFFDGYVLTIDGVEKAFVEIDILPKEEASVPHIKVYLNNKLLTRDVDYEIVKYGPYHAVVFSTTPEVNDKIDVKVFSETTSQIGYYDIPENLDLNPLNESFTTITLGQLRTHYNTQIENTTSNPANPVPTQDNYLKDQVGTLRQHSAPLVYAMSFLTDPTVNFVDSLTLARKEYTKFKNKFLSLCNTTSNINYSNPANGVDIILQNINTLKNSSFPWYYSDMVPQGGEYTSITYTVLNARQVNYEITSLFDNTVLSNRAVLVYVNGVQQIAGVDYNFSTVSPTITFTQPFTADDVANKTQIVIRDYPNTDGNYIPETPTKLGLYPKFVPEIFLDNTYQTPINVIRGHDGSLTPAFGDFRDDYLLELERRIYNNIKSDYSKNEIDIYDTIPGRFRDGDFSAAEYNQVINQDFLKWVGVNNVDYTTNKFFEVNNPWSWNYGSFPDRVDGSMLQGSWRAIYNYWFDTDTPNLTPWIMLGFSSKPLWWNGRYGPGPYTSGNTLLWEDLENGYIWNNGAPYVDSRFVRPGLTSFIPVDTAGNLVDPTQIPLIKSYHTSTAGQAFTASQGSPAETAWRRSSDYPYAVQFVLALSRTAKYFSTQLDTSRFSKSLQTGQFSNASNRKIAPNLLTINGKTDALTGVVDRTSGYLNWIVDNIKNLGIDPITTLTDYFANLSVRLSYKVSGFTDQNMLTVTAEQTTPGSTSGSVIIPDTNYQVYLNKSVPIATAVYSAVIVEKVESGFSVTGYDPTIPFFNIIPSTADNNTETITTNGASIKLYRTSSKVVTTVPYGTVFSSVQQTADFLVSYQRYLLAAGFTFAEFNADLKAQQDWMLSVQELLYWSQQGWKSGSVIVLNPVTNKLKLNTFGLIVDEVTNTANGNKVLNQDFVPIKNNNFNIVRQNSAATGNRFTIESLDQSNIAYAKLNLTMYEHVLVFDNIDDFGDIVYIPSTGTRQYRLKLAGSKTGAWDGSLSATGYIYSDPVIAEWQSGKDYQLGDIVQYSNFYYTATQNIPASISFVPTLWTRIPYSSIQTGLLPSFSLNAQEFVNFYDVDNPPTDETLQKYSAGLIGFRQRQYLTDLGIGIPTQTKFYQGYIKEKGSMNAITALTKANFNNVNGDINVYEEWAFLVGKYGSVNNNVYKDFVLDQSIFKNNPVVFTSTNTYNAGNIIVQLNGNILDANSNVYTASNTTISNTTLYSNRIDQTYMADLPDVGYMNINDVDYTIFDVTQPGALSNAINDIGAGDKVWVAKNINKVWDVLRINESRLLAETLTFILDNNAQLTFNNNHTLEAGDIFVLKYFDKKFDGVYEVLSAPTDTTVVIAISDIQPTMNSISPLQTLIRALVISGSGIVYTLDSAKLNQLSDLITAKVPYSGWKDGDKLWIDNASANGWGVYTFNQPWHSNAVTAFAGNTISSGRAGGSVRLSSNNDYLFVGSPNSKQVFVKTIATGANATITVDDNKFGSAIDSQGNLLSIASSSNVYVYRHSGNTVTALQTITGANLVGNVTSISMSADQRWLYIGGNNVVQSYVANAAPGTANVRYFLANVITNTGSFGNVVKTNATGNVLFVSAPTATNDVSERGNVYTYKVATDTQLWFPNTSATSSNITLGDGSIYYVTGSINAPYFANISTPQTVWTPNTDITTGHIFYSGNTYTVLGNVYGATFSLIQSLNRVAFHHTGNAAVTLMSNTRLIAPQQTLTSHYKNQSAFFGTSLDIDSTANNLYIGVPGSLASGQPNGVVERYTLSGNSYVYNQTIIHPDNEVGTFGTSVGVSANSEVLAVGSLGSSAYEHTTFDNKETTIDSATTEFIDHILNSGATYVFEVLKDPTIVNDVGSYVYTQQLETQLHGGDLFGSAVDVTGTMIAVGAPGTSNFVGSAFLFKNPAQTVAWTQTRTQQPIVDVDSISRSFLYNKKNNNLLSALDFVDPAKGKVLNAVAQDIDFQRATDPALYNAGTHAVYKDLHWGPNQVGKIWWDLDTVRYINYEQDALIYRLNHWGNRFPGSSVDVYQWVASSVLPSNYSGPGTPKHPDNSAYSTYGYITPNGTVNLTYYFWVKNIETVAKGKHNSIVSIAESIENPQSQGIPYAAVLRDDTVALYNVNHLLVGQSTILELGTHIGDTSVVHSEYALVQEGNPASQLPPQVISKINDSISGIDVAGNPVPDPALPPSRRYGLSIRPRQTIILDVNTALYNVVSIVNEKLLAYPVTQRKVLSILNSSEAEPIAGAGYFDIAVDTLDERGYIDTTMLSTGDKVLVHSDSTYSTKWAIYEWTGTAWVLATRTDGSDHVQTYKTNLYWYYADWYDPAFDPTTTIDVTVANQLEFGKLTLEPDTYIKVLDNGNGNFVIYYVDLSLVATTVGIQSGTIQLPGAEAEIPPRELRQILRSLQEEIFIDDLAKDYNDIFFIMIKYILSEQRNVDWVFKTSFISATQSIRKLQEFPSYIADNQNFYLDYIDEVKPYRTVVREFVVDYVGNDSYSSDITDFDLPPYWDANVSIYRSPSGEQSYDDGLLSNPTSIYSQWYNNYKYQVVDTIIERPGNGYLFPPQVVISGGGGTGAEAYSTIDANGNVSGITITNSGSGYTSIPTVTIIGTSTGTQVANARAVLRNLFDGDNSGHNLVRSISTTIKFGRVTYANLSYPGVIIDGNTFTGNIYDATISSSYTSSVGVSPEEIVIDGGAYVGPFSSYAPEELVPGRMYDTLSISVFSNTFPTVNDYAFRLFHDMNGRIDAHRISAANTTTLTSNLTMTANVIQVVDASRLPLPNPALSIPGVVFIGGEKITYYKNYSYRTPWLANATIPTDTVIAYNSNIYVTNGNVYGASFADVISNVTLIGNIATHGNAIGQVRRGVDGTAVPGLHLANTRIVDASIQQSIPISTPTFANIGAANVTYTYTGGSNVTVRANTVVATETSTWYTPNTATGNLTCGNGLINSTTVQATFLLASPGYMP